MVDERLQPWPPEVREAVARFRQGDVIRLPSIFYLACPRYPLWALSLPTPGEDTDPQVIESEWSSESLGLITSQTCDIAEDERPTPRKPWIQVSPVYQRHITGTPPMHMVRLTGVGLTPDSYADLRIELPIEKGWLVDQTPVAGFADAEQFRMLALRLALQRRREAFPTWVVERICAPLRDEAALRALGLLDGVEEIRLAFEGDDLSSTRAAGLMILAVGEEAREALTPGWSDWCESLAEGLSPEVHLLPVVVLTADTMRAREYRRTAPVWVFSAPVV